MSKRMPISKIYCYTNINVCIFSCPIYCHYWTHLSISSSLPFIYLPILYLISSGDFVPFRTSKQVKDNATVLTDICWITYIWEMFNYPTSMKLWEGNIFTRVCLSFITARKRSCRNMFSQVCVCRGEGVGISGPMFLPEVGGYLWYQVLSGGYPGKWALTTPPYMGYNGMRSTTKQYMCYLITFFSSLLTGTGVPMWPLPGPIQTCSLWDPCPLFQSQQRPPHSLRNQLENGRLILD